MTGIKLSSDLNDRTKASKGCLLQVAPCAVRTPANSGQMQAMLAMVATLTIMAAPVLASRPAYTPSPTRVAPDLAAVPFLNEDLAGCADLAGLTVGLKTDDDSECVWLPCTHAGLRHGLMVRGTEFARLLAVRAKNATARRPTSSKPR